jgi:hypothetical protein
VEKLLLSAVERTPGEGGGCYQTELHTAEPFVPEPSASEVEVAVEKLKRYKSPGFDQIPAELIRAEGETLLSEGHKLSGRSGRKKNCLTSGKRQLWYLAKEIVLKLTVVITQAYHCCQLHTKFCHTFFSIG